MLKSCFRTLYHCAHLMRIHPRHGFVKVTIRLWTSLKCPAILQRQETRTPHFSANRAAQSEGGAGQSRSVAFFSPFSPSSLTALLQLCSKQPHRIVVEQVWSPSANSTIHKFASLYTRFPIGTVRILGPCNRSGSEEPLPVPPLPATRPALLLTGRQSCCPPGQRESLHLLSLSCAPMRNFDVPELIALSRDSSS